MTITKQFAYKRQMINYFNKVITNPNIEFATYHTNLMNPVDKMYEVIYKYKEK